MRQRKVKNEEARLEAQKHNMIINPEEIKGKWKEYAKAELNQEDVDIYLEIGCGRGQFLVSLAEHYPQNYYIGVEGRSSIVLRTLELIDEKKLTNARCIFSYVDDITNYFDRYELAGIYLNFSDPWPKARHAKRRLTHRRFLEGYKGVLKPGHFIEFKTDNDDFFNFTLEECTACGLNIVECTNDLHSTNLEARLYTSQYEERFILLGTKINYCKIQV
ncbi:MAG: tRNA (guanosine(46)-N7)-methyltransferase TrmB [Clostridiales bacterium]|jgi:tRNA (guanine-N7-)-methyltransferase|nr:tRNA (guanosine(46)-N7)-methyltransferase TrmB [Clostridiales bacterium]